MILFEPLSPSHLSIIEKWFQDARCYRYLGGMLPVKRSVITIITAEHRLGWVVHRRIHSYGKWLPVGMVDVELEGHGAFIRILVAPEHRRQGNGKAIVKAVMARSDLRGISCWNAVIHRDNRASLRLFRSCGFVPDAGVEAAQDMVQLTCPG